MYLFSSGSDGFRREFPSSRLKSFGVLESGIAEEEEEEAHVLPRGKLRKILVSDVTPKMGLQETAISATFLLWLLRNIFPLMLEEFSCRWTSKKVPLRVVCNLFAIYGLFAAYDYMPESRIRS